MDKLLIKQALFFGSYLVFPVLAWLAWRLRRPRGRLIAGAAMAALLVFVWARFVEPQMLRVRETTLPGTGARATIALVSDIHLGVYKDTGYLRRVVDRLNTLQLDAVLIAGDLTYEPGGAPLREMFAPLAELRAPVHAVLGNHDQQAPGPDIDAELRAALAALGVEVIEGRVLVDPVGIRWAGLGDRWAGKDDPTFLRRFPDPARPTFVLAHNPDSAIELSPTDAGLVLAGHTHGGQIRIPLLYPHVIPSVYGFDRGERLFATPRGTVRVFVTSGLGEIGLPMRLFNPPTIDVLHLRP
ncbi:metallophosphoesterase [Marilutibacter chinensis]|uniref:Metallophosphoesterase n=1 Tax=Marilutibacter chinensis TaxID=2912247 RepID=A0ABS9HMU0_9GAMM|nr:metallophosphoesterase [Lysobacter chinensis]MCF7220336.1 metallophosphoesterase [Lysobacter chinensis]